MIDKDEEKVPVLVFLLEHNKFQQLTKVALNRVVSNKLLNEYGDYNHEVRLTERQSKKIRSDIQKFTLQQIIQLRGSHEKKVKYHQNPLLVETLKEKYKTQSIDRYSRERLWLNMTQYYQKRNFYANLQYLEICPDFACIIEKDLNRTRASNRTINIARELLYAYAKYNPYIGYIQGMNDIAVFLVDEKNQFTAEQAFFILKHLTQQILPVDYYTNMKNIIAYLRIFFEILHQTHNRAYQKIKKIIEQDQQNFIAMLSLMFQEFVCIFTRGNLFPPIVHIIWDFMMMQGITALFKAGLAIFDQLQETILQCQSFQQYDYRIQRKFCEIKNQNKFKKRMQQMQLSGRIIQLLKNKIVDELQREQQNNLKKKSKPNVQSQKSNQNCEKKWNFCMETVSQNSKSGHAYEVLVFKNSNDVNLVTDYLNKLDKQFFQQEKQGEIQDALVVGRIPHTCRPKSETNTDSSLSEKLNEIQSKKQTYITPEKHSSIKTQSSPESQITTDFTVKKIKESQIRKKAAEKITVTKKGMSRSESTMFLKQMTKNASLSNLLDMYELDEMFE